MKQFTKPPKVGVHQCFSPRQGDPFYPEFPERRYMSFQFFSRNLSPVLISFPDVAHYAAAIAATVGHQHQNGQGIETIS
jgi:hypothetical protein